jgi:predicted porin
MKKSLVALAVLAAAGAASAQSSVTLFGVVDAGVSYYTVKSRFVSTGLFAVPPLVAPVGVKRSQTALSNSGYNSSRIGFRGTEDLGGGLAASFWLEAGISNDDGAKGINNFNRRSTVSLSGGFGEIRLGRDYTPSFWNDTVFDPFGTNGVGTNLISTINTNLHTFRGPGSALAASDNYVRTSNSIGYFLPPNLGGFYGQLQYALHENVKFSDTAGSPSKRGRYVGGRFGYATGPLDVAASYGQSTAVDAIVLGAPTQNKIKTANLGASYDFGVVKLFGEVSRVKDNLDTAVAFPPFGALSVTSDDKYTGALVGVTVPVGAGLIRAAYSRVKFKDDLGGLVVPPLFGTTNIDSTTAHKFAIGYVHNLSKRTALYATAARIRIKDGQNNPVIMGATTGGAPTYLTTPTFAPRTATGYDFGIRHAF